MKLDDLLAREEIHDVIKRLARGTDRLDAELIASCYHPDGYDDHNVFRGWGTDFAQWVLDTLDVFDATMHFVGSPYIRLEGDVAQVDTYCVAHHLSKPDDDGAGRPTWSWACATSTGSSSATAPGSSPSGSARSTGSTGCRSTRRTARGSPKDFTVGARDRTDITYQDL